MDAGPIIAVVVLILLVALLVIVVMKGKQPNATELEAQTKSQIGQRGQDQRGQDQRGQSQNVDLTGAFRVPFRAPFSVPAPVPVPDRFDVAPVPSAPTTPSTTPSTPSTPTPSTTPSSSPAPIVRTAPPVPTALVMRQVELDTSMRVRFMYARGIGMRPSTMSQPQCAASVDCYETVASQNKFTYCVVVIDLVEAPAAPSAPAAPVLVVADAEGRIEFTTAPAVVGNVTASEARGKTHIVYTFTIPTPRADGANEKVRVRVHSSVDRAVFLWSESEPRSTSLDKL